jgi:OOP family OmpA-OmpF porin
MKKSLLCMAVLAAACANAAMAHDHAHDDRWYLAGTTGVNLQDNARETATTGEFGIGIGRFFTPEWSLDVTLYSANAQFDQVRDLNFSQYGFSADLRRHFRSAERAWWPYLKGGVGIQRAEEEFNAFPSPNSPGQRADNSFAFDLGAGLQAAYTHFDMRLEAGVRTVLDDQSRIGRGDADSFSDPYIALSLLVPLGAKAAPPAPAPAPAPAPVAPPACETLDDDGDGVNNCIDRCPGSQAGQAIGPDGCPVPLTIDLRGVNFDFDRATLRPDAIATLNQAIDILRRNPQLRVEVAGHTDLCGSEAHNQALSERRARAVFDHLTANGIDAARLVGPIGFGESRPLEPTPQTSPACRSETNRRTELNVLN